MGGYIGGATPVAIADVQDNSVENSDIQDGAVTDDKLNSATLDQAVIDIDDNEILALAGL